MSRFLSFIVSLLLVFFSTNSSAKQVELNWVGCGISKKAYVTDLVKSFEQNTGIRINVQGGGATKGIREVNAGQADLGGSCRYMLPDDPREAGIGLEPVAWDALVIIVHKDNPIESITPQQVKDIYLGKITDWAELGEASGKIQVFTRKSKNSGVGRTLRKLLFADYDQTLASTKAFKSSGPLEKSIMENTDAIAITGVSSARLRDLKILKLDNVEPSVDNIRSGQYTLYRPLYLTYNPDSPNIEEVQEFIRFVHSRPGRDAMKANGVVPYKEALRLLMKQISQDSEAFTRGLQMNAR